MKRVFVSAAAIGVLSSALAFAQAQAPAAPAQGAPAAQPPAPGQQAAAPAKSRVGTKGEADPGVNYWITIDNDHVRVLQVTLQPGAVRRTHVHNDVTFHMMVPVTGSLELTIENNPPVTAAPGQAYYMMRGQNHGFTNKTAAPVQVMELFVKPTPTDAPAAAAPAK